MFKDSKVGKRKQMVDTMISKVYQVCLAVAQKGEILYTFSPHRGPLYDPQFIPANFTDDDVSLYITDLMEGLRRMFPGCEVNFRETTGYTGNIIASLITIDWS
jgi:hypothetical protein